MCAFYIIWMVFCRPSTSLSSSRCLFLFFSVNTDHTNKKGVSLPSVFCSSPLNCEHIFKRKCLQSLFYFLLFLLPFLSLAWRFDPSCDPSNKQKMKNPTEIFLCCAFSTNGSHNTSRQKWDTFVDSFEILLA